MSTTSLIKIIYHELSKLICKKKKKRRMKLGSFKFFFNINLKQILHPKTETENSAIIYSLVPLETKHWWMLCVWQLCYRQNRWFVLQSHDTPSRYNLVKRQTNCLFFPVVLINLFHCGHTCRVIYNWRKSLSESCFSNCTPTNAF